MSSKNYAGFSRRLPAYIVDSVILLIVLVPLSLIQLTKNNPIFQVAGWLIPALYFVFFWVKNDGQTIGNKLLAIKVIKENNEQLDIVTGIIRYVGYTISWVVLSLGYLWIIWDKKKQGWHDKMAHTLVIETDEKPKTILVTIIMVVILIPFLLVLLYVVGQFISIIIEDFRSSGQAKKYEELTKVGLEQSQAGELASKTFSKINIIRQKKDLLPLQIDEKLCAYAQKRLDQLASYGKWDYSVGFSKDTADQNVWNTYFSDYSGVNEDGYSPISPEDEADIIAGSWFHKGLIVDQRYTHACVKSNRHFIEIIIGVKK